MTRAKDTVLASLARYSLSNFYRQAMSVAALLIQPKLLPPELYGLWSLLKMIPAYATYAHLGARDMARYAIPFHASRGEEERNAAVRGAVMKGSLAANLGVAALTLPLALLPGLAPHERAGVAAAAAVVLLTWRFEYQLMLLKADQDFRLIARLNYLKSTASVALSLGLIWFFGIWGLYAAAALTLAIPLVYMRNRHDWGPHGDFSFQVYKDLARKGLPITLFEVISVLLMTSGRALVSWRLGNEQLGYFALSAMVLSGLMQVPGAAREIIEPRLMERMGQGGGVAYADFFLKPLVNTAFYMPFLVTGVVAVFPSFCALYLPRYASGVPAVQVMALAAYCMALVFVFRGLLVALDWQAGAIKLMVLLLGVNLAAGLAALEAGLGITGMAAVTAACCGLLALLLTAYLARRMGGLPREWRGPLAASALAGLALLVLAAGSEALGRALALPAWADWAPRLALCWLGMYLAVRLAAPRVPLLDAFSLKSLRRGGLQ
ncbi:MAG: oligosaccharide flippase family protein [Thermodesulfobacteriota bacterium]